jgi:ABC-type bacteriocin/lantibiotic exporter with double-glycine peptidase domain
MSELRTSVTHLSAIDVLFPGPGEAVHVENGPVLAFALDPDGRRISLATLESGQTAAGCSSLPDGTRLLLTGLPGTSVRLTDVNDIEAKNLNEWVRVIGLSITHQRRPRELVIVTDTEAQVDEGAVFAMPIEGEGEIGWASVTAGQVRLCDVTEPLLTAEAPALPVSRDPWLTAHSDSTLTLQVGTNDAYDWSAGLDLLGRLSLSAAIQRQHALDEAIGERITKGADVSELAVQSSVDLLAASVGGELRVPTLGDAHESARFAAAVTVAQADGLEVTDKSLQVAEREVETGRDAVIAVADSCGARSRAVNLHDGWRTREGRSLIAQITDAEHAEPHHHVVALVWKRRGWVCIDAQTGTETPVDDALAARLAPEVIELLPVLPTRPTTIRDVLRLAFRGSSRDVTVVAITTILIGLVSFFTPYLLGQLATLFTSDAKGSAYVALFGALIIIAFAGAAWQLVRSRAMLRARSRAVGIASGALWERSMRQPASWHDRHKLGDRMAQANAVTNSSAVMSDDILARLLDATAVVGTIIAVATTNTALLISILLLVLVQIGITALLVHVSASRATNRIDASAAATGRLLELMRAVNRIRVAGAESRVFLRWAHLQARFTRADQSLRRISMAQGVIIAVWPIISLLVIVFVSAVSGATFGQFITAQTASAIAAASVAAASIAASSAIVARRTLDKAEPLLQAVPESGADGTQPGLISGGIDIRDLVFRYAPGLAPALDSVSLAVKPGEHVAIVGPSGCGKTTLMRVILGLANPDSGVILIDGKNMATLNRPAVRRQIGSVLQSSQLLAGPLRQNIDMGRGLTTEEVWEALDAASMGADVRAMPLGLDTPIADGAETISGGQRQRILIARALAANPRMLILDEATSALDNLTQAAVIESLQNLRLTRIVVAHRLSTIREADRIIVMDAGRVVDEGTYEELFARPGAFREMALRQQA